MFDSRGQTVNHYVVFSTIVRDLRSSSNKSMTTLDYFVLGSQN